MPVQVRPVPGAGAPTDADHGDRRVSVRAALIHVAVLVLAYAVLLYVGRFQWFYGDEFDFIARRDLGAAPQTLLEPHNEHWSTLPMLAYRALYHAVGLRSYLPYMALLLLTHVTVVHLAWRVAVRAGARPALATIGVLPLLFFGPGSDSIIWAFQITFNGSVAFGLAHVLLVNHQGPFGRRDAVGQLMAVASLACSGIGVTMVAAAGLTALVRRGWKAALSTIALPAMLFVAWLLTLGRSGLDSHDSGFAPLRIPAFVARGLSATFDEATGVPGTSLLVAAGLVVWLVRHREQVRFPTAPAVGCAGGAVVMFVLAGLGRAGLSLDIAASSRYLYVAAVLSAPLLLVALSDVVTGFRWRWVAAAVLLLAVTVHSGVVLRSAAHEEARTEQLLRGVILASASVDVGSEQPLSHTIDARLSPDLHYSNIVLMDEQGRLPPYEPTRADELAALSGLQTLLTDEPVLPVHEAGGAPVLNGGPQETAPTGSSCVHLSGSPAVVTVRVSRPSALELHTSAQTVEVILVDGDARANYPREYTLDPARTDPVYLNLKITSPIEAEVVVHAPEDDAATQICGVTPQG